MAQWVKNLCSAGDTGDVGLIPGSGRSLGGGNGNPLQYSCLENSMDRGALRATVPAVTESQTRQHARLPSHQGFPSASDSKESTSNVGDTGLIPGSGRSLGGGNGNPLQYSCHENSMSLAGYSPWGGKESGTTEHTLTVIE